MLGDNEMPLTLTKDLKNQNCTKDINVVHYYVRELVENRKLAIEWISSLNMLANDFTKALPARPFKIYQEE